MKTKMLIAMSILFCNFTFANEMNFNFEKIEQNLSEKIELTNQQLHDEIAKKIEKNFEIQFQDFIQEESMLIQTNLENFEKNRIDYYNDITK